MAPVLLFEACTWRFYFFVKNQLQLGLTTKNGLYKLYQAFEIQQRSKAFSIAAGLAYEGMQTVITVSEDKTRYTVWVDLRYNAIDKRCHQLGKRNPSRSSNQMPLCNKASSNS